MDVHVQDRELTYINTVNLTYLFRQVSLACHGRQFFCLHGLHTDPLLTVAAFDLEFEVLSWLYQEGKSLHKKVSRVL